MNFLDIVWMYLHSVFCWLALGAFLLWLKVPLSWFNAILKKGIVLIGMPLLVLQKTAISLQDVSTSLFLITSLCAIGMVGLQALGANVLQTKALSSQKERAPKTFVFIGAFQNYGFLAYPLALNFFGDRVFSLVLVYALTCDALIWATGKWWFGQGAIKKKDFFSPPLVGLILAFCCKLFTIDQIPILQEGYQNLAFLPSVIIPMAIVCMGASMGHSLRQCEWNRKAFSLELFWALGYRTIVLPVFWMLLLLPLRHYLPHSDIWLVIKIEAIMPASVGIIVVTQLYGGNHRLGTLFSVLSNLASCVTIPLFLVLFSF